MTQPGGIHIDILADGDELPEDMSRAVMAALREVQAEMDRNPLQVKLDIDTAGAVAQARADLQRADLTVHASLEIDTAGALTAAETALNRAVLTAYAELDIDTGAAITTAQAALNAAHLTARVELDIDTAGAVATAQAAIDSLNSKSVSVKVDVDASEDDIKRLRQLASAMKNVKDLTDKSIRVRVDVDMSEAEMKRLKEIGPTLRSIRTLTDKSVRVKVDLDMSEADLQRLKEVGPTLRAIGRLSNKDIKIKIDLDVDEARLAAVVALLRQIRSHNARVSVDTNDANSGVSRLLSNLGNLAKVGAYMVGIPAAIAAIGGAAGAAAGLVGGLVAAIGAIGPAAAAIGATAVVGMQGIMDSFKAFGSVTDSAAEDAQSRATAVAAANKQVESAERSLQSAQKASKTAQEDVTRARKSAEEQLKSLALANADAALAEKEAGRALEKARADVRTAKTADERKDALLAVERAELTLAEAQERNRQQQAKSQEMTEKGVEGSDEVVAAKEREAAANDAVAEAAANLTEAQAAVTKAQTEQSSSTQKLNQELAKLAPNAREFVLAAHDLGDEWTTVRKSVQDNMFAGLGATLTDVAGRVLPALQTGMGGVATELNGMASDFLNFAGSEKGLTGLNVTFENSRLLLAGLRQGTGEFSQGLIDMATAATPYMQQLGQSLSGIGASIGAAFTAAKESGELGTIFGALPSMFAGLGDGLGGLVSALLTIAADVVPVLGPFFTELGAAFQTMAPGLGELGRAFIEALTPVLPELAELISSLATGLAPVLPVIADLLIAIGDAIEPMIGPFSQIVQVVGTALADALTALQPAIAPLATAFTSIITALAPIIPVIAQFISMLIQALAPAITTIFNAIAPVIAQLAEQLKPVFEKMMPIIAEVATVIGQALADALTQLAPVLPPLVTAFSDLLLAILPILPELAKMAASLLPPLVSILVELVPLVVKIYEAFTWLVKNVILPLVMPAIEQLVDNFKWGLENMGTAIGWLKDAIEVAITAILAIWDGLKTGVIAIKDWFTVDLPGYFDTAMEKIGDLIQKGVDKAKDIWAGLKEAAAVPIRWVVTTVWNNGLRKAWNGIAKFLPGMEELPEVTLGFRRGGAARGPGSGTSDDILARLSNGEHVLTASDVVKAGGQNVVYAIRDMIQRGVPFEWDGGQVVQTLGRDNLSAYGAAVKQQGYGQVDPEGLFDPLLRFAEGGAILPWMYQLQKGHEFAKAQDGRPYQWAGPRFVGDSFDCSGFMASIIAAIQGGNPWTRYWATSSFAGYPAVGAQGLTRNLINGSGMAVGITDDPGGPGGGHTAGELRGIPELGIPAARVESGGALGDVHYGRGTNPASFASLYGLPIGANGFFEPSPGGDGGPTPAGQLSFVQQRIKQLLDEVFNPLRSGVVAAVGEPPPLWRAVPPKVLDWTEDQVVNAASGLAAGLGDLLPGAWTKAKETASAVLDAVNPFDSGGIASGKGIMSKDVIEPERVLSPEQTRLFEALVAALQSLSTSGPSASTTITDAIGQSVGSAVSDAISALVPAASEDSDDTAVVDSQFLQAQQEQADQTGQLISDTQSLAQRTASSFELVVAKEFEQLQAQVADVANKLAAGVIGPVMESAVTEALGVVNDAISGATKAVVSAVEDTTTAVKSISDDSSTTGLENFGQPGSAWDAADSISDAIVSVANTASSAILQVGQDIAKAALEQKPSTVDRSRGNLGDEGLSGGPVADMIVQLTGVQIEVRDLIESLAKDMRDFRGEEFRSFDESGQLISDTAGLLERTASSMDLVVAEQNRINRALIKAMLRYLMLNVFIPILTAIMTALITVVTTAIGAAIGSIIPVIGTAVGAAIGALVGTALSAAAAAVIAAVGVGAGAAIDSFDSGGVASGMGFLPKATVEPERVLSPRQTVAFEELVSFLGANGALPGGNRTLQIGNVNVHGREPAQKTTDDLLSLLAAV